MIDKDSASTMSEVARTCKNSISCASRTDASFRQWLRENIKDTTYDTTLMQCVNGISNNPFVLHFTLIAWEDQSRLSKRAKAADREAC